jgi:hypothetical protein
MRMRLVRTITVSGFAADANPNITAPADADTFLPDANAPGDQKGTEGLEGIRMCLRFVNDSNVEIPAATASFTLWAKDDGASDTVGNGGLARPAFVALKPETLAPSSGSYACALKDRVYVQVTALGTTTGATKCQVWAEASTSIPG